MRYVVVGIDEAFQKNGNPIILDIAAIAADEAGRPLDSWESHLNHGDAAEGLRAFLEAHTDAKLYAFNAVRARRLLLGAPWNLKLPWIPDPRRDIVGLMYPEKGFNAQNEILKGLKLHEAAKFFKITVPMQRSAHSEAMVSLEILVKMVGLKDTMDVQDDRFLLEAKYLMEDGF
jgi:hypothetical protein